MESVSQPFLFVLMGVFVHSPNVQELLCQLLDFFHRETVHVQVMHVKCFVYSCRFSVSRGGSEFRSPLCRFAVLDTSSSLEMVHWMWEVTFRSRRACSIYLCRHQGHLLIYVTSMSFLSTLFCHNMFCIYFISLS